MIPRLREDVVVRDLLCATQELERAVIARLAAAHLAMEAAYRLDVVVEDVGARADHGLQRSLLDTEEVGCQHFDRRFRELRLDRTDRRRVVARAFVGYVVPVDRRDDDVLEIHLRRRLRKPQRLERIDGLARLAGMDVAVPAGARARLAEDLERRRTASPALGDVRAACLFADRVEAGAVDQLLDVEVAAVRGRRAHLHPLGATRALGDRQ